MSVVLVVLLTYDLAKRREVPWGLALGVAVLAFGLSLPYEKATNFATLAKALGSSGLFLAIGIALLTVDLLFVARRRLGPIAGSVAAAITIAAIAAAFLAFGISRSTSRSPRSVSSATA
jgi:cellobiose-specific phosphotransferase system component IIC